MTMARPADTRVSIRVLLAAASLLIGAVLLMGAAQPGVAVAQTGCTPTGDDGFTPGPPGEPPPGGVVVDPGEPCPETEPVTVTPTDLPPEPVCDPCPSQRSKSVSDSGSEGTATTTATGGAPQALPYTGLDAVRSALLLGGLGLVGIGVGLGLRRRASHA
jgi:LPXTG-motif cell wall-anchored protein